MIEAYLIELSYLILDILFDFINLLLQWKLVIRDVFSHQLDYITDFDPLVYNIQSKCIVYALQIQCMHSGFQSLGPL
jgi:hypothetical protein